MTAMQNPETSYWYCNKKYAVATIRNAYFEKCKHINVLFGIHSPNNEKTRNCESGDMHLFVDHESQFMIKLGERLAKNGYTLIEIAHNDVHVSNYAVYLEVM